MQKRRGTLPGLRFGFPKGFKALAVAALLLTGPIAVATAASAAPSAAIVIDAKTGKVLYASNADEKRYPASLTKMMTLYLLFEALEAGKTSLDSRITISAHAADQAPSKLGLKPGETISVRDAILSLVTKSANDIAVAIAEHVGGTEKAFAARMTKRAHDLGMVHTTFRNANGLPNSGQMTTARDLSILARALREHYPQYYSYFSTPSFVWRGRRIANHDMLLGRVKGVNGIKTGYTRASGFNLVTSLDRDNRRVIGVVLGGTTAKIRDNRMVALLEEYAPKASRGARTAKAIPGMAKGGATIAVASATAVPPLPRTRPDNDADQVTTSSIGSADDIAEASSAPLALAPTMSIASLVGANSIFALDAAATEEGDTDPGDETADAPPPRSLVMSGWRIQLAATPTQSAAEDLLDRALAKGSAVLAHASPYTEAVKAGNTTLYRARFAGFSDKESARNACAYLTRQKFNCLAVAN
jgi:D-alanyl-D-alanine carboxypeptidase